MQVMMMAESRGLRGSVLEEMINMSNEVYRHKGLALIQKVPTPITPINIDKETRHITLAYFEQKSTVDYIGVVQGIPVCFDAKECSKENFSLQNLHEHQFDFMSDFEKQNGIAFIILYFTKKDEQYYIPFSDIKKYWERARTTGPKHIKYDEIDKSYRITRSGGVLCHYLVQLQYDLNQRG